jgi:hypothetical protein
MLGFVANDTTLDYKFGGRGAGGEFVILSGSKPAVMPKVPNSVMTDGKFIAYESGRIFLIGDDKPKATAAAPFPGDGFADMTHLYEYAGGVALPKRVEMPRTIRQLVQGRNEQESLILGGNETDTFFMRFDGTRWVDVPVPKKGHIWQIAAGDDGTVWFAPSSEEKTAESISHIYRGSFPDLHFTPVALPPGIAPLGIWATNANDVWVSGTRLGRPRSPDARTDQRSLEEEYEKGLVLLHTQEPRPPFVFPSVEERDRQVLLRKVPAPYSKDCTIPFLILGPESIGEPAVETFRRGMAGWPFGSGILGRTRSGKVYGFDLSRLPESREARPTYRSVASVLNAARAKLPSASVICTRPVIEKTL